ncbi:MAG: hypothetical protein M1823_001662 [Watsoniomyces obsoletus]|nr:MAG: hypothetical protein M1823_001662 [Watsoniomyces obsoletus]
MASHKCVHKGCGKVYTDPEEDCIYHPGPPIFHEGQKGWKCCKPRVLTFDEFLSIPPCTTGKHSEVDDTPVEKTKPIIDEPTPTDEHSSTTIDASKPNLTSGQPRTSAPQRPSTPPPPPESESDDPSIPLQSSMPCRRRGCHATYSGNASRDDEKCIFHPGVPIFHDGGKGYTCCRRRVLEFDEFMKIEGCQTKSRHLFAGSGKKSDEKQQGDEVLEAVRNDFYQTSTSVIVSFYLKKIDSNRATVAFSSPTTIDLDLPTTDQKRYKNQIPLYAPIDPDRSAFKIMGTKLEMTLAKANGSGWPSLRSDAKKTGEIIQVGQAGRV